MPPHRKQRQPKPLCFMAVPSFYSTEARNETFGGVTYHIEGELVPALHLELSSMGVYFEHHILLWKDPWWRWKSNPPVAFKRLLAGMPFLLTGARAGTHCVQSRRRGPRLRPAPGARFVGGRARTMARRHQTASNTPFTRVQRRGEYAAGRHGDFFIDTFSCAVGARGFYGSTATAMCLKVTLAAGARRLTSNRAAGFMGRPQCVQMQTIFQKLTTGLFGPAAARYSGTVSPAWAKSRSSIHVFSHGRRRVRERKKVEGRRQKCWMACCVSWSRAEPRLTAELECSPVCR